jgi:hypothetical protein
MSDKVELIAAAQVAVSGVAPAPVSTGFNSSFGFENVTRTGAGGYDLKLEHKHDVKKLVINVTRNSPSAGSAAVSQPSDRHIQVNTFDASDAAADVSFYVAVFRIGD